MGKDTSDIIRIIVVDDSAFMRKALTMMLESDPQIKVIATARDGEEGIEKVKKLKPDLVTMDIEMPRMDGLTALRQIMLENPTPVMMISSLTTDGATATLDALEMGAVDFIPKQLSYVSLDIIKIQDELLEKIKNIARRKKILMSRYKTSAAFKAAKGKTPLSSQRPSVIDLSSSTPSIVKRRSHLVSIIAIGSSTGGPPALQDVITRLPRNLPVGIVIAQHMPASFTKSLAERLDSLSQVTVREATDGETVEPGLVLISPGGQHLSLKKYGGRTKVVISTHPSTSLYKPSVDILMHSASENYGKTAMGVILTGMGHDGVDGMKQLKSKGGVVIAQDEATCVVYGMPRAVVEAKIADHISPINNIAGEITSYF